MNSSVEPKYDNDLVNLGYLNRILKELKETTEDIEKLISKSYSSPPPTPYYKDSLLSYDGKLFQCIRDRTIGEFNWGDWKVIANDSSSFIEYAETTYFVERLQIIPQVDGKIETHYQSNDPSVEWGTDLVKKEHVGDYWYDTSTNKQWKYVELSTNPITYRWEEAYAPMTIYDKVDGLKNIFIEKPNSYKKDDIWIIEDTLPDEDMPIGTEDNPIKKGDWVIASSNSESYDKTQWSKRNEDTTVEFLEHHFYNTKEVDRFLEETNRSVNSKISEAKDEIAISVESTYETKEHINEVINDYDEQIGEINRTLTTHEEEVAAVVVENGRIAEITSRVQEQNNNMQVYVENNNIEVRELISGYASSDEVSVIRNEMQTIQTESQRAISIVNSMEENGVTRVRTEKGFTFDNNGLTIDQTGTTESRSKTNIDTDGVKVYDKTGTEEKELLFAGYDSELNESVVRTENIRVTHYLNIGSHARIEDYTEDGYEPGIGFFFV